MTLLERSNSVSLLTMFMPGEAYSSIAIHKFAKYYNATTQFVSSCRSTQVVLK